MFGDDRRYFVKNLITIDMRETNKSEAAKK